jgi:hypothetical protein
MIYKVDGQLKLLEIQNLQNRAFSEYIKNFYQNIYNNKLSQYVILFLGSVLIILGLAYSFQGKNAYIYVYPIGMGLFLALVYLKILSRMFSIN